MKISVFINPVSKIYIGPKVDISLFHTIYFISCNDNL